MTLTIRYDDGGETVIGLVPPRARPDEALLCAAADIGGRVAFNYRRLDGSDAGHRTGRVIEYDGASVTLAHEDHPRNYALTGISGVTALPVRRRSGYSGS